MKQLFVLDRAPHWVAVTSIASAMVLSACATSPETAAVAPPPSFQSLMDSADAAQKQNLAAQAMAFYEQAAKADPASKQPWLRMAQSHFDSRSYGQAITASQEALHRDNTDVTAKSLMAASGLRVSADALEQLRQANAVGGSTKTEAQVLVRIMRDAVGEASHRLDRGGGALWRLISHLSLNHLSLTGGGLDALKEMMRLYDLPRSATNRRQVDGLTAVEFRPATTWLPGQPFATFVRGTEVRLTVKEEGFVGTGLSLFAAVLDQFFGLYVHINSFTQLTLVSARTQEEIIKCPPRNGANPLV